MYQPARVGRGMGRHRSTAGLDPAGTGQSRGVHIPPESGINNGQPSNDNIDNSDNSDDGVDRESQPRTLRSKLDPSSMSIMETPENTIHRSSVGASTSKSVPPPPLAIVTMPVVPSQPPSLSLALQPQNGDVNGILGSQICNNSPPPSSPSTRSVLSVSTSEPSGSRRGCMVS
jgi:hypothetical protein